MLDVGEQQFLVLLLVLQAQLDDRLPGARSRAFKQVPHARIDLCPIGLDARQVGAADLTALRPRMLVADGVAAAVEKYPERGVEGAEIGLDLLQHEGFEKPGDVGQMPFRRAGVGHRLQLAIGFGQRRGQVHAALAHRQIASEQRRGLRVRSQGRWDHVRTCLIRPLAM